MIDLGHTRIPPCFFSAQELDEAKVDVIDENQLPSVNIYVCPRLTTPGECSLMDSRLEFLLLPPWLPPVAVEISK